MVEVLPPLSHDSKDVVLCNFALQPIYAGNPSQTLQDSFAALRLKMTRGLLQVNYNDNQSYNSRKGTKEYVYQSPVVQKVVADSNEHASNPKSSLQN